MQKLKKQCFDLLVKQNFDCLAVGVIDFKKHHFECFELTKYPKYIEESLTPLFYFDLASVTKPLTMAMSFFLFPNQYDEKLKLLLNHSAGLPDWGLLSRNSWRDEILSYNIEKSKPLYSDYSALRLMLEFEEKTNKSMHKECAKVWDKETLFWKDLPNDAICPPTGFRGGRPISGVVHDPNAYTIGEFCSHAGLFSTITGLCRTMINYDKKCDLLKTMKADMGQKSAEDIFVNGWDTASIADHQRAKEKAVSLAGAGHSNLTFGFLGFTGTSVWIDPELMRGHIILTNGTKNYWFSRTGLNELRRAVGESVWKMDF